MLLVVCLGAFLVALGLCVLVVFVTVWGQISARPDLCDLDFLSKELTLPEWPDPATCRKRRLAGRRGFRRALARWRQYSKDLSRLAVGLARDAGRDPWPIAKLLVMHRLAFEFGCLMLELRLWVTVLGLRIGAVQDICGSLRGLLIQQRRMNVHLMDVVAEVIRGGTSVVHT